MPKPNVGPAVAITQQRLKEVLQYDPNTGVFTWLVRPSPQVAPGSVAGSPDPKGYLRISIDRTIYPNARLAWLYMTGEMPKNYIDHINRDRQDNRWVNLRQATHGQNTANSRVRSSTGFKGVSRHANGRHYEARITTEGRRLYLGIFLTPEEAHEAYMKAARQYHGEFACAGK